MILKEPCPRCQSNGNDKAGDNLVSHPEHGYKKCFACDYFVSTGGKELLKGKAISMPTRGLSQDTCNKYGIENITYSGHFYSGNNKQIVVDEPCVLFNYIEAGKVEKQKLRSLNTKSYMKQLGNTKYKGLFGKHLFSPTDRLPIVITEGEYDAAAVHQATGLPAVSIPNGINDLSVLVQDLNWLQGWKFIALCFDNDEAGKLGTEKAINLLPVGKVRIVHLTAKDANEMLLNKQEDKLKAAIWNAEAYHPESIISIDAILDKILIKPQYGLTLPWEPMYQALYGLQEHHLYSIIGFSKVGKTEFLKEIIFHLLNKETIPIGIFSLEQGAASTVQRMVASLVHKPLHLPSNDWWDEDIIKEHALSFINRIHLYDNSSRESLNLETLLINIRYMYYCFGVKVIIVDNLTAMCTNPMIDGKLVSDEVFAGHILKKLFAITRELPISLILVAHIYESKLNRQIHIPTSVENKANYLAISEQEMDNLINKSGLDWSSGRMPGVADVHKMVGRMSDYVIGLSRNIVSPNEVIRSILKVKFLATRLGSEYCGKGFSLQYKQHTGRYELFKGGIDDII